MPFKLVLLISTEPSGESNFSTVLGLRVVVSVFFDLVTEYVKILLNETVLFGFVKLYYTKKH